MTDPVTPTDANDPIPVDEQPEPVELGAWQDDRPDVPTETPDPEEE